MKQNTVLHHLMFSDKINFVQQTNYCQKAHPPPPLSSLFRVFTFSFSIEFLV